MTTKPSRGDVWDVDLNPSRGHEQGGARPALIMSVDTFNHGPAELVIVLPITSKEKRIRTHVPIDPPHGGLTERSFAKCEDIRSISTSRLIRRRGTVSAQTITDAEFRLQVLLGLS